MYTAANWQLAGLAGHVAGDNLTKIQVDIELFIAAMKRQNGQDYMPFSILLYHHARMLRDGLCALDAKSSNNIPTEEEARDYAHGFSPDFSIVNKIFQLIRAYLIHQLNNVSLDSIDISSDISKNTLQLRPDLLFGLYFEGLASFYLARQTRDTEGKVKLIEKGDNVLTKLKYWSEHSSWNWESKVVLLEAEKMYTFGNFDQASLFYERAIRVSREHKLINDEAISSELAGTFFCQQLDDVKAEALLLHSVQSYKTWGALAVATRVETYISNKYGTDSVQQKPNSSVLEGIFAACNEDLSKKRKE